MSKLDVLDRDGKTVSSITLEKELYEFKSDPKVVRDTVAAYLANNRNGNASTKIKKELSFSGAKPWRQKGTGRARCGEKNSPLWRKGGVAFGPRPRSFRIGLPRKVKLNALRQTIADKLNGKALILVDNISIEKPKTKDFLDFLAKIKAGKNALVVLAKKNINVEKASRNVAGLKTVNVEELNTYDAMAHKNLVIAKDAFEILKKRLEKD